MEVEKYLSRVPDSKAFMTVEEMEASTDALVAAHPDAVKVETVGHSQEGRPIRCLTIGSGPKQALIFGCPHPNEPIGAMMLETLTKLLAEDAELRAELPYTFSIIKCVDPDGLTRNQGWLKGPFTLYNYARDFYRPASAQQVEWSFPLDYKTLHFHEPLPETQALMKIIETRKPEYLFSLHNSAFGGAYWYMNKPIPELLKILPQAALKQDIPLSLGEPEMACCRVFDKAIFEFPTMPLMYSFYEEMIHGDPAAMITGGSCSVDFANEDGRQCFGIVCEMPYFLSKACMDESPAEGTRCDAVLKCYDLIDAHTAFMKPLVEELIPYLAENNAYALALKERMSMSEGNSEANRNFARTNPEYQQTVTKAQLFDNLIAMPFYTLLGVGMVKKAAENAAKDRPADAEKLLGIAAKADAYLKEQCEKIEAQADFEPAQIRRLVSVQLASALLSLSCMK